MGEIINITYFDPSNSIFKVDKNEREHVTLYKCDCKDYCDAYEHNKCVLCNPNGWFSYCMCPHGDRSEIEGYTKYAKHFGDLIRKYKTEYKDLCYKLTEIKHVQKLVDYWYLNLPWLDCKHYSIFKYDDSQEIKDYQTSMTEYFKSKIINDKFVKDEDFNLEFLNRLLDFKPTTYMNSTLFKEFHEKYLPQFFYDLRKYYPEKYNLIHIVRPEVEQYANKVTFKGKFAKLNTLNSGKVKIGTNVLYWNGNTITTTAKELLMWGKLNDAIVTITPTNNSVVEIVDDETVNDDTEFV